MSEAKYFILFHGRSSFIVSQIKIIYFIQLQDTYATHGIIHL